MNKLGTKLGAVAMSAVMALSFAPSAAITSLAAGGDDLTDATQELSTPVYRLYNPNSGEHLFTVNENECDSLDKNGWDSEGIAWYAPSTGDPVYRLYNPNAPLGDHHYTASVEEKDNLVKLGWRLDATAFNTVAEGDLLGAPVYRLYNPNASALGQATHHLTLRKEEADGLALLGWNDEGPKFYEYAEDLDPEVEELTVSIDNTTPKVGDTLTATVEPDDAEVTYKWTINGKGAVTTETFEVPADANSGDAIKLVVTDAEGNTAEDTVYVGGFTILKVEPTTDAVTGVNQTGYKYIRAYFSNSLKSLDPEDIELRSKDTEQLYSIDTVKLSSDGTYADITLFGSVQEGGTTFLQGGEIYVMTITSDEVFDTYEFELPIFESGLLVTNVDIEKGKITLEAGARIGGEYEVGDVYTDNLGTLVGRTVNVGVNSDKEIEKLTVRKAEVVYGVMKYADKAEPAAGNGITDKDYFEDQVTKNKYYLTTNATTTIKATSLINVVTGTALAEPANDVRFEYAKLVLNSNGTVACAVLNAAWIDTIRVADVEGTIVTETTKANLDFDGYTIEKDGEYITPSELEEDDIIFYDSTATVKFAEVYNNVVDGTPSDINSATISIDGDAYKWYAGADTIVDAKYYDKDNDAYVEFNGADADDNVAAQKILTGYDADLGVTAYLDRLGNIAYIDGTDAASAVTTDTWYVTTSAGTGYAQALAGYLKFTVSDGTKKTIEVPVAQLTKFNGVDIKKVEFAAGVDPKGKDFTFTFTPKKATTNDAFGTAIQAQNLVEKGVLVKITEDENGKIIGISFPDGYTSAGIDAYAVAVEIDDDDKALKPGVSKIDTDDGLTMAKLTDKTNIWVYTTDKDDAITVTKEAFADYTRTTNKVSELNLAGIGPFVLVSGSSVTDILLRETLDADDKSDTFAAGDTTVTEGVVKSVTTKKNKAGDANYTSAVTIIEIDGSEKTYEALDETALAEAVKDQYVALKLDKATGKASKVTENDWTNDSYVDLENSDSKTILTLSNMTIKIDTKAQVLKREASGYKPITLKEIVASTKPLKVEWHDQYYNLEKDEHYADFLVVKEGTAAAEITEAARGAVASIARANAAYGLLSTPSTAAEQAAYEAADAQADADIATWAALSGDTASDANLGTGDGSYATFASNATKYTTAKTNIDAAAATSATWLLEDAMTTGKTAGQWGTALETELKAVYTAIAGYTFAETLTTGTTLTSTVDADTNKIDVTVSKDGYSKTWTVTVTDMSDAAKALADAHDELDAWWTTAESQTTGDLTASANMAFADITPDPADDNMAACITVGTGAIATTGVNGKTDYFSATVTIGGQTATMNIKITMGDDSTTYTLAEYTGDVA